MTGAVKMLDPGINKDLLNLEINISGVLTHSFTIGYALLYGYIPRKKFDR